jgi:hypothetical protein
MAHRATFIWLVEQYATRMACATPGAGVSRDRPGEGSAIVAEHAAGWHQPAGCSTARAWATRAATSASPSCFPCLKGVVQNHGVFGGTLPGERSQLRGTPSRCPPPTGRTARVGAIRKEAAKRLETTIDAVLNAFVVDSDPEARRIFGLTKAVPVHTEFRDLVDGWREKFLRSDPTWLEALSQQIMAAVQGRFPTLRWELMRSMDDFDGTWYAPVVNYVRTIASSKAMQFDVYFDKFELNEDGKQADNSRR